MPVNSMNEQDTSSCKVLKSLLLLLEKILKLTNQIFVL